jgi:hypothetical protein
LPIQKGVFLYGVVQGFKPPHKTKGKGTLQLTDYGMSIVVTDPTLPMHLDGLSINIFKPNLEDLPKVQIGSILNICIYVILY